MMARAGFVTSQVAWLYTAPIVGADWREYAAGTVLAAVAAYGPDLDHDRSTAGRRLMGGAKIVRRLSGGHRMGTHSIAAVAIAYFATLWLVDGWTWAATAVAVGWGSHIFTDLLTVQGVGLLWPLSRRKFRLATLRTGGTGEVAYTGLMTAVGVLLVWNYVAATGFAAWLTEGFGS